jgi:hypothetical protein
MTLSSASSLRCALQSSLNKLPAFTGIEEERMSARRKLNAAFFNGSIIVAAVIGLLFESWTAFAVVLALLLVGSLLAGEIRPGNRRREHRRPPTK